MRWLLMAVAWGTMVAAAATAQPTAEQLVARSIGYHDPDGRLLTRSYRLQFVETRPGGTDRQTEVVIDVASDRFAMKRHGDHEVAGTWQAGDCVMTLDGRQEVTDEERKTHRLDCPSLKRMRDYYTYLWALPMKLRDPGTHWGDVAETTYDGRPVYGLRVTYDEGVGSDVWYVYFNRETAAMVGYRFYHDEAKNDGEYILLEGETTALGLRLPKKRTWFTHQGDRLLGTDTLVGLETAPSSQPSGDAP